MLTADIGRTIHSLSSQTSHGPYPCPTSSPSVPPRNEKDMSRTTRQSKCWPSAARLSPHMSRKINSLARLYPCLMPWLWRRVQRTFPPQCCSTTMTTVSKASRADQANRSRRTLLPLDRRDLPRLLENLVQLQVLLWTDLLT